MSETVGTETETVEFVILSDDYHDNRYPVPRTFRMDVMASDADKWRLLAHGGITQSSAEQTPLQAWRDAVAVASGLSSDHFRPELGRPLDLGFSPAHVRSFVFYLA